jgi:hypothetical protein
MASHHTTERHPPRAPARAPLQHPSIVERILCILFGFLISAFGFGLALLGLWFGGMARRLAALPLALFLTFIGLFGLNWLVQGVRGRSRHQGLFYAVLRGLRTTGPRVWSLLVPSTALVALILGTLTNDRLALDTSLAFLSGWAVFMANIEIHEFGHLLGATASGLRVGRMIIGPVEFTLGENKWRVGLSREWLSIFGGFVLLAARKKTLTPREELAFASGGPIATLVLFIVLVSFSPARFSAVIDNSPSTLQQHLCDFAMFSALGTLFFNLLPAKQLVLGSPSDGYQILAALRGLSRNRILNPFSAHRSSK